MEDQTIRNEMLKLFDSLLYTVKQQLKKAKDNDVHSTLIFDILNMTQNNRSKLFSSSGTWVTSEVIDSMLERGIVQKVVSEENEKYALTFKGITQCIQMKYGVSLQEQFLKLLELSDEKFNGTEQSGLTWKEKLASLSLILVASASISSEIRLDDEANKTVLNDVFEKTLACLKKFGIIKKSEELKLPASGEHPVLAIMRRVNDLTRKTNLYYLNDRNANGYYFDIEKNGDLDEKRVFFLLRRIFEYYDPNCDYKTLYTELATISQLYSPRFRGRVMSPNISFTVIRRLKDFMENEVLRLPQRSEASA